MELITTTGIMEDFWSPTSPDFFTGLTNDPTFATNVWNATDMDDLWNSTDIFSNSSSDIQNSTGPPEGKHKSTVSKHYPIIILAMMLSIVALSVSIAVYATLPEFRNVHGKNLVCVSGCLLSTYLLLSADLALRGLLPTPVCFAVGMVIQVTFLGTFFWTNVMAFDIWRSLTDMRAKTGSSKAKFRRYAAYAWSATVITALPAALLEVTEWVPAKYRPKFGAGRCWLNGIFAFLHYFNMPVGFILLSNLVMFVLTLRKLAAIKKMTAILNVEQQRERFRLYTKLFLVMGITWTSEYLPWMTGKYSLYAIAGTLTALHGCFLFFIFVCKKRILRQFYETVILKKDLSSSQYSNSSSQQTSSSSASNKKNIDLAVMKA